MKRRLAAILIADVVGYSRLMEDDEVATLAALRTRRASVLDPAVRAHAGRIVKLMGDGVLMEFSSAVNAVAAALDLQSGMARANTDTPENRRIIMRIGINLGDVIGEGRDIFGDSVNIAARLETLADPGGICVSGKVFDEVERKIDCNFEDMGPQSVKNISRNIRTYRVLPATSSAKAAATPDLALPDKPSIAVLPFQNMSADAEQEYFADGIVEDIITELSRASWLFVIARNSSFTYKGRAVDIKQVGRELGVRYVLEGSVRRAGVRVRITGQLIDAATGAHLWADRFDGEVADIFDLQDQVTQSVVGAIAPKLELAEINRAKRKPTENLDAYDHYHRGMAAFYAYTRAENIEAVTHFTRAFELDPTYAAAFGMVARCYAQRSGFGWITDRDREGAEALRLARFATELGPDDAVALAAAGFAMITFGDVADGDAVLTQALAVNPNLGLAWIMGGFAKALIGQADLAVEHAQQAMRLSPQDPQLFAIKGIAALGHFVAGRYEEAFAHAEDTVRQRANFPLGVAVMAATAALTDRQELAEKAVLRFQELQPGVNASTPGGWLPFQKEEDSAIWLNALRKAGLPD